MAKKKKNKIPRTKILLYSAALFFVYILFKLALASNISINADVYYFYVPKQNSTISLSDTLSKRGFLKNRYSFRAMAYLLKLMPVDPGMYEIRKNWNNYQLITHFQNHTPRPSRLAKVSSLQSREHMVKAFCKEASVKFEPVWKLLHDDTFLQELEPLNKESVFSIFIPKQYRIYTSSNAEELIRRMHQEYLLFWNDARLHKAREIGLKPQEIHTLASIVYAETKNEEEMATIAGVYINRLQQRMRLESDPTLLFAANKFGARRVFFKDKNIASPYNTYKNKGLPPGPIYTVPHKVIDKVLEYEGHDFLFFCAKDDFSGQHHFAETYELHKENARRYREKLNSKKIY
jgi:UPF0755 protein